MADALLNALEEDARTQSASIIEEAGKAAAGIIEEAEKEASSIREERLNAFCTRLKGQRASSINIARVRAGGLKLKARREIIDEVLDGALKSFKDLPGDEYAGVLNRLYEELKKEWLSSIEEKPVVLVNPEDLGIIKDRSFELRSDPNVSLGVVFISGNGRLKYENTIPSRIKRMKAELVLAVNKILFGES